MSTDAAAEPDPIAHNRRRAMQSNLFDDGPPSADAPPQFATAAKATSVPGLTAFPDLSTDATQLRGGFDLGLKPKTPSDGPRRRLNVRTNDEMRKMRERVEKEFEEFSERIQKLARTDENAPGFSTETRFVLPDGPKYEE